MKKLGFGAMRLPLTDPNDNGSIDFCELKKMVDLFMERGFTYFDTAWMYCDGKSESAMKEALVSRYPRDSFTLTSKLPHYMIESFESRDQIFEEQLRRTGAGYFDYYLLHNISSQTIGIFEKYDCFSWIVEKKRSGAIKGKIGFSFHDGPELLDALLTKYPEMELVQLQLNYLDWDSLAVQSHACYDVAVKHGKSVLVMEPIKGGTLAKVPAAVEEMFRAQNPDMSVSSWAIRFAASLDAVMVVLSGMSNLAQMDDNTNYMRDFVPLTAEEQAVMLRAAEMINSTIAIPCTGCSYCTTKCPQKIAIPQCFSLYNADMQELKEKAWTAQANYYRNLCLHFGKASDCIKCGRCEALCPQKLPIREYLEAVAKHFGR